MQVVTDTTDQTNADALGINTSGKLRYGAVGKGARRANLKKDGVCTVCSLAAVSHVHLRLA